MSDLKLFTERIGRFARIRRRLVDATLSYHLGTLALASGVIGLGLLSGWLPNAWVNIALFSVLGLFWLILLVMLFLRWSRRRSPLAEAFRMEELAGGLNSRIVSAWDFLTRGPETPLTRAVIGRARDDLRFDFEARLDRAERDRRRKRFLAAAVVFLGLGWFTFAGVLQNLTHSWFAVREALFPVKYEVAWGKPVYLLDEEATVHIDFPGREYTSVTLVRKEGKDEQAFDLPVDSGGRATYSFKSDVKAEYELQFKFGSSTSEKGKVIFTTRPKLENMQTEQISPTYTGVQPRSQEGVQSRLVGLPGTRLVLGFTFNKDLEKAALVWDNGTTLELTPSGRFATGELLLVPEQEGKPGYYGKATLKVRDLHGFKLKDDPQEEPADEKPVVIEFVEQPDDPPRILLPRHLQEQKQDLPLLEEQAKGFGFSVQAEDDFGITSVVLQWQKSSVDSPSRIQGSGPVPGFLAPETKGGGPRAAGKAKVLVNFENPFAGLDLKPGDKVTFWVEAEDNRRDDNLHLKPQKTASRRCAFFVHQDPLGGLSIKELGFGNDAEMGRDRIPKATKATAVKAPEGLRTKEGFKNEFESAITTGTQAPTVRGEFSQATRDYFRLFSKVKYPEENPPKKD